MPIAQINGVRLNYLQVESQQGGGAEDLVMVHGLATNMAFWYFRYAPVFSRRYRVTLYDLRGHGRSEMPDTGYRPHDLAVDLQQLLDHLGIERAHFVAHSFGGVVALNMGCLDPGRVSSLVLADTHISALRQVRGTMDWAHGDEIQATLDKHGVALDTRDPYFGYRLLTEVAHLQLKNAEVPSALLELVSPLIGNHGKRTAAQWLKLMDSTRAESELMGDDGLTLERVRQLSFPIMAMYGSRSLARVTGNLLLDVWPHAEFLGIHNAGHFFPISKSGEVISACDRFWGGKFSHKRMHRQGEPERNYFRSDRIYQSNNAWYCLTRESAPIGPFSEFGEASGFLNTYISERESG